MLYAQARGSTLVASSPEILCKVEGDGTVTNRYENVINSGRNTVAFISPMQDQRKTPLNVPEKYVDLKSVHSPAIMGLLIMVVDYLSGHIQYREKAPATVSHLQLKIVFYQLIFAKDHWALSVTALPLMAAEAAGEVESSAWTDASFASVQDVFTALKSALWYDIGSFWLGVLQAFSGHSATWQIA